MFALKRLFEESRFKYRWLRECDRLHGPLCRFTKQECEVICEEPRSRDAEDKRVSA